MAKGNLEKMLILAFEDSKKVETGGPNDATDKFEVLINPESYTLERKVKTSDGQGQGTSGAEIKFEYIEPPELSLEFLFDNTGIIDGKPDKNGVADQVKHFTDMLTGYHGSSHEPYHLKLVWGDLVFKGRAIELSLTHKLFNPDGQPIRTLAKVKFRNSIEDTKRALKNKDSSADLTQIRKVKKGDTLPLLCSRIYGDPQHYLAVARQNGLDNFRSLVPGKDLQFPPFQKTDKTP